MRATTIKAEGDLLERIEADKPADRSLSAHVPWVLRKDLERRQARDAGAEFKAFIDAHPDEQGWLSEWDGADLATAPARGPEA